MNSSSFDHREQINWTFEENKLFENALAELDHGSLDFFEKIAARIPGKTLKQLENHFQMLIEDIEMIESGLIPLPDYENSGDDHKGKGSNNIDETNQKQRKKGIPWTEEEHELFLEGLKRFGKGDWRSISRMCVASRTPSQVASHAQKYFLRLQNSGNNIAAAAKHKRTADSASKKKKKKSST